MSDLDIYFDQHAYWERERQEGPTDWGHADDGTEPRDPTPEEWVEIQAEFDRGRLKTIDSLPVIEPSDGDLRTLD